MDYVTRIANALMDAAECGRDYTPSGVSNGETTFITFEVAA